MAELTKEQQQYFEKEVVEVIAKYHALWHPEWKRKYYSISGKAEWYFSPEIHDLVNKDLDALFQKKERQEI